MERRKNVLVLDFDDDMLIALERVLEDSGFQHHSDLGRRGGAGIAAQTSF
jgi:hypothetical protein